MKYLFLSVPTIVIITTILETCTCGWLLKLYEQMTFLRSEHARIKTVDLEMSLRDHNPCISFYS